MSAILIIILALTVNSLPPNVKSFSAEMSPTKTLHFAKQADGGWDVTKATKNKSIGTFYVDGLTIMTKMNEKEHKIDSSKFLGIKTVDQIKGLKEFKMGAKEIKIEKKDSGILIHMGENPIKISWKEK